MRNFSKLLVAGVVFFGLLQLVRPRIPTRPATAEVQAPPEVRAVLRKDCYSCHSDERRLAWFDQVVPAYWLVRHDVLGARGNLNFSTLGAKPAAMQKAALYEAVNMMQLGAMPLPQFVKLHPEAKVTPEDLATLKAYLAPWSPMPTPMPTAPSVAEPGAPVSRVSLTAVAPELDGFPFDSTFEGWKPISTTDRGDNNTFRFILGNDVAVKAAQTGNISPWPDGASFAKIAWQQQLGTDGLMHPGKFIQVELMQKNARRYKANEGWGWGRWRGADLKPYGADARFVSECTSCHQPLRGNDYVYTTPITTAKVSGVEVVNNIAAALPTGMPYQPLGWNAITMYVDRANQTTATLYGNDQAIQSARASRNGSNASIAPAYPPGAVLALVTWKQRDDPHWFGGRIPDAPQSVEFVQIAANGQPAGYRRFTGAGLAEDHSADNAESQRVNFVLRLAPAWLP